jgi:hypothetical protein
MGQQDMIESDGVDSDLPAWRTRMAPWLRRIAACALALTIGLGQAYADSSVSALGGGEGRDKEGSSFASAEAFGGDNAARASSAGSAEVSGGDGAASASSAGSAEAFGGTASPASSAGSVATLGAAGYAVTATAPQAVKVTVDVEEEGVGTPAWTRTVTFTKITSRFVKSVTRSQSFVTDEEGNLAIAKAVARARAPNNVAAVRNGAGNITAKTSVEVTGNGVASADAGGSIGIARGGVKVETWGRTSAEVF